MKREFEEKKVFIAGSSGGIGYKTAELFLEEGAFVMLHGRNPGKLLKKKKLLEPLFPNRVSAVSADITNAIGRKKLVTEYKKKYGGALDVLVISVGNGKVAKTAFLKENEWLAVFQQNFFGIVNLISDFMPLIKKGKDTSIIIVGSIAGIECIGAPVSYASAKASLNSYAKHLSVEIAKDGVRVATVHPGNVYFESGRWEELLKQNPKKVKEHIKTNVPQGRFGLPGEIAEAILFLASSKAGFITGASLVVDGGQHTSL